MKVTIRDIARECSVSPFTVSSVINNKRSISQETRQRVMETIKRLGYDPAKNAPHVRNRRTRTVGLVVPVINSPSDLFFFRAMTAAKQATYETGMEYRLFGEEELSRMVLENHHGGSAQLGCDALVMVTPWKTGLACLEGLAAWDIPVALIRRTSSVAGTITLADDDIAGAAMIMEHLHGQGHRVIAYVTSGRGGGDIPGRREGYLRYIREKGLQEDPRLLVDEDDIGRNAGAWIKSLQAEGLPVTAVFCSADNIAARTITSCIKNGLHVPEHMAVAGYDDDMIARRFYPAITSVHVPLEEMVAEGVRMLGSHVPGTSAKSIEVKFENRLVVRESTVL